ncbi:MAG: glutamine synthetase beta-grasp domain-containing protein [Candidatus Magasanikbacteria bacterium]|nr:glutamine synthetase beta-grasp domain-containing protein [Candidatus Magasanikbacteria bacterium]
MAKVMAEYIWLDGYRPTPSPRSKTKVLDQEALEFRGLPDWGFDGSSTEQAEGKASDCLLRPVRAIKDPVRGAPHLLVLCEVFNPDGSVHPSNTRAALRLAADAYAHEQALFGIEQEYTMFRGLTPLAWPAAGTPAPQGPYYCGVGADKIYGRQLAEAHLTSCLEAGLTIAGINSEVMPGQWEFQVGPLAPLPAADELWLGRWLLQRLGEEHGITVSFAPKPVLGDWNGAGAHTNFSTRAMREPGGLRLIEEACRRLREVHLEHIAVYGAGNEQRLTGAHETCAIGEFRYAVSDRGASIRIPMFTAKDGSGYLEDRRPAANMDPYQVCARLLQTVCGEAKVGSPRGALSLLVR